MKAAVPTREQAEILKRNGLMPFIWQVLQETDTHLTVIHTVVHQVRVIEK